MPAKKLSSDKYRIKADFRTLPITIERLKLLSTKTGKSVSRLISEACDVLLDKYTNEGIYTEIRTSQEENENMKELRGMIQPDGNEHKATSIIVANHKGGVAKTTTCAALAHIAGKKGYKVLLIDSDAQKNLTEFFGPYEADKKNLAAYMTDIVKGFEEDVQPVVNDYIVPTCYKTIDIIKGDMSFGDNLAFTLSQFSSQFVNPFKVLFQDIQRLNIYDYIFVDTSPQQDIIAGLINQAADYLIVPTETDKQAVEGAARLCSTVLKQKKFRPTVNLLGIVFTKVDDRTAVGKMTEEIRNQLNGALGTDCLKTVIPTSSDISKSRMVCKPVTDVYASSKVSKKYEALFEEVVTLIGKE